MNERKKQLVENAFLPEYGQEENHNVDFEIEDGGKAKKISHKIIEQEQVVFKQYKNLTEIAEEIAEEMLGELAYQDGDVKKTPYKNIIDEGLTFFMSPGEKGQKRSGLLSICPAVLTAMKIWEALQQGSPSKDEAQRYESLRDQLRSNIIAGVDAIFKIVYRGDRVNDTPIFDASPYESDAFWESKSKSYIDSITWAVPVFLKIMNLTKKDSTLAFDPPIREKAKALAKWCLKYINDSLIKGEDGKPIGWSFTKLENTEGAESSIYFNYAVSTIYLAFYAEYKDIIEHLQTIEENKNGFIEKDDGGYEYDSLRLSGEYWKDEKALGKESDFIYDKLKEKENEAKEAKNNRNKGKKEQTENKLKKIYQAIEKLESIKLALDELRLKQNDMYRINSLFEFNDGYNIVGNVQADNSETEIGQLSMLKSNLLQVAEGLWNDGKNDLENNFFHDDPEATLATEEAIKSGGQTNALFTGLLQISIMLNCAYDLKIQDEKGLEEYEKMQDAMFLHVQKAQRFFNKLEREGKSFGVDNLIIRFMESTGKNDELSFGKNDFDSDLAEKLRKAYIRVFPLTPMLLKTNNLLSEYVIQYPQKQMGESLLSISRKRFFDKSNKKARWLWEIDKYHAITNYYYVDAIFEFYKYYDKYELKYIRNYGDTLKSLVDGKDFKKSARKHYQNETNKKYEIEKDYKQKLEAKDKEIKAAEDKAEEETKKSQQGGQLVDSIKEIIQTSDYFDHEDFLKRIIKGFRNQLAKELFARFEKKDYPKSDIEKISTPIEPKQEEKDKLFYLLQALIADIILPSAIDAKVNDSGRHVEDFGFGAEKPEKIVSSGARRLITDGLINEVLANIFSGVNYNNPKYKMEDS